MVWEFAARGHASVRYGGLRAWGKEGSDSRRDRLAAKSDEPWLLVLSFQLTDLGHQFIVADPLGEPITDGDDGDVRCLIHTGDGLKLVAHLLRIAIDVGRSDLVEIGQLLWTVAIRQC